MKTKISAILILFLLSISLVSCQKKETESKTAVYQKKETRKNDSAKELKQKQEELDNLKVETELLLESLKKKELDLVIKEAKLDSVKEAIAEKEKELLEQEILLRKNALNFVYCFIYRTRISDYRGCGPANSQKK